MGRTIIAEDGIEHYGLALAEKKELVVGLIFGQELSSQKSCVIHLSRSPEPSVEDHEGGDDVSGNQEIPSKSKTKSTKAEDFDDAIVLDHVRQVFFAVFGCEFRNVMFVNSTGHSNITRRHNHTRFLHDI